MHDLHEVDATLLRQLNDSADDALVIAAVSLRRAKGLPADPELVNAEVEQALGRAEAETGMQAVSVRVLAHLAVAYVEAPSRMVRALLEQPEVTGAMAGTPSAHADDGTESR